MGKISVMTWILTCLYVPVNRKLLYVPRRKTASIQFTQKGCSGKFQGADSSNQSFCEEENNHIFDTCINANLKI